MTAIRIVDVTDERRVRARSRRARTRASTTARATTGRTPIAARRRPGSRWLEGSAAAAPPAPPDRRPTTRSPRRAEEPAFNPFAPTGRAPARPAFDPFARRRRRRARRQPVRAAAGRAARRRRRRAAQARAPRPRAGRLRELRQGPRSATTSPAVYAQFGPLSRVPARAAPPRPVPAAPRRAAARRHHLHRDDGRGPRPRATPSALVARSATTSPGAASRRSRRTRSAERRPDATSAATPGFWVERPGSTLVVDGRAFPVVRRELLTGGPDRWR